jgi:CheY-like chemotaxis protein
VDFNKAKGPADEALSLIVCGWPEYDGRNQMAILDLKALLGAAIKAQRSTLGISQEELAYRAGLHRTYVSDVERGARNPSLESVEKLAQALELSVPMLFQRATHDQGTKQLVEILLIEDNPLDVRLTLRAFEKAHITNRLHVARDGVEALDFIFATGSHAHRAEIDQPQIILHALNLPRKSGLEVLREIKADERTQEIAVIVLTASTRGRDISECRRLGADRYIVKPVGFQNFSEVMHHFRFDWALVKPKAGHSQNNFNPSQNTRGG